MAITIALAGSLFVAVPATDAAPRAGSCSRGKSCTGTDTIAPTLSISSPASGATISGSVVVSGTAADSVSVARVDVKVDAGPFRQATGTTSWAASLSTSDYSDGAHTITAKATDTAGNVSFSSAPVSVSNGGSSADVRLTDPVATQGLALLGRGKMAETGKVTGLLYWEEFTSRRAMFFRDASSGTASYVSLPVDSLVGWSNATYVLSGNEVWVWGGGGPVYLRHYQLSGSPMPTSAALVSTEAFGDTDSRRGDLTLLASGGLVAVWNQQGGTGPQGLGIAYRSPGGAWQTTYPLYFMPTMASKQVVAQHPADGSVWVFNNPDAWGEIGAVHLTEVPSGLTLDWTDAHYIFDQTYGDLAPDPENPDLVVATDPSTASLVLAYQSRVRQMFSTYPAVVTGSHVAVARIGPGGPTSFLVLPSYVERISALGLVVRPGETWLAYRPVDPATLAFDKLYVSVHRNGAWGSPTLLGTLDDPYGLVGSGISRAEFSAEMADGALHFYPPA